jgi:hypothetical protein
MERFKNASVIKHKKESKDLDKVNLFISQFNKHLTSRNEHGDGSFHVNSYLDKIPILNDSEFALVVKYADMKGWTLTQYDDNYQSKGYKLVKKKIKKII